MKSPEIPGEIGNPPRDIEIPRKTGREAVAEVVLSTEELMEDFLRGTSLARRNHRLREGSDKSMLGNVMERVLAGRIDPRDAQKNVPIEAYREGV